MTRSLPRACHACRCNGALLTTCGWRMSYHACPTRPWPGTGSSSPTRCSRHVQLCSCTLPGGGLRQCTKHCSPLAWDWARIGARSVPSGTSLPLHALSTFFSAFKSSRQGTVPSASRLGRQGHGPLQYPQSTTDSLLTPSCSTFPLSPHWPSKCAPTHCSPCITYWLIWCYRPKQPGQALFC